MTALYHDITDDGRPAIREHGSDEAMLLDVLADVEAAMEAVEIELMARKAASDSAYISAELRKMGAAS